MIRIFFFCSLLFLVSCSEEGSEVSNETKTKTIQEDQNDAEIKAIDAEIATLNQYGSSMRFSNEAAYVFVKAYANKGGQIIKLEEEFSEGDKRNTGRNMFYYKNGEIFASREYYSDMESKETGFVDRITIYKKGKAIKTKEKRAAFEEELDGVEYQIVKIKPLKADRAEAALNQEGPFELTFQGFMEVNPFHYLVVGARNSEGYTTALRVEKEDEFIKTLLSNQKKYHNRKVEVEYQNVIDDTGFSYQLYTGGRFLD